MTTRIRLSDRAARIGGTTLLAAAVGLAAATPSPTNAPSDHHPATPPTTRPDIPAAAPVTEDPRPLLPQVTPIDFTKSGGAHGIPTSVLAAYRRAATTTAVHQPHCGLRSELLAAIGRVESAHARGGQVDAAGTTLTPILGPVLSGEHGFASIADTDEGKLDGDRIWDRAVGPMQFIPGTWTKWTSDGNEDGAANPHNVYDASLAAARYLCANGRDLNKPTALDEAILSYNNSPSYLRLVLAWMRAYTMNVSAIPDDTSPLLIPVEPEQTLPPPTTGTPPPTDTPAPPAPEEPTEPPPTSTPPTTTTPPPSTTPPGPAGPVLCVVGGVITIIGSLLGAPPPEEECE